MATTNIRWQVAQHLLTLLRTAHAGEHDVIVAPGYPGDEMKPRSIWIDRFAGLVSIPVMTGARMQRDDIFDIHFKIKVRLNKGADATMEALTALLAELENIFAESPELDGVIDGVIAAEITDETFGSANDTREGHIGAADVVVSVHARLT